MNEKKKYTYLRSENATTSGILYPFCSPKIKKTDIESKLMENSNDHKHEPTFPISHTIEKTPRAIYF